MILVTANPRLLLLQLTYVGVVTPDDLRSCRADVVAQGSGLGPGFTLLVDLSPLTSMPAECMSEVGLNMETVDRLGVGQIVRVIPEVSKDIGMNIMTIFHYPHRPRVVTCRTLLEALEVIAG